MWRRSGKRHRERHVTPADKQLGGGTWNGWLKTGAAYSFIVTAATSTHCRVIFGPDVVGQIDPWR
jgi:hypothetical protein